MIVAYFDGACWPNPGGHAASGAFVERDGQRIFTYHEYIGKGSTSNNVAEYHGLIAVLKFFIKQGINEATVYGDSDLVIKQMSGIWKARVSNNPTAKPKYYLPYYAEAAGLRRQLSDKIKFQWIPREKNRTADALSRVPLENMGLTEQVQTVAAISKRTSPPVHTSPDTLFDLFLGEDCKEFRARN